MEKENQSIEVSIILINYNSSDYTIQCINSIRDQVKANSYEIIVVDNDSKSEDFQKLESIENIKLLKSSYNSGFANGNWQGVEVAKGKYYFFLNNDCLLLNDCVSIFKKFLDENPNVALVSGQMYNENKEPQTTFGNFPTISEKFFGKSVAKLITDGNYYRTNHEPKEPIPVDLVTGSAMFIRADKFHEVGGFDKNFFLYCEEEDLAYNLRKSGHEVYVIPEAKFIHYSGKSSDRSLPLEREFFISLFYYYNKRYPFWQVFFFKIYYFIKLFKRILKGKADFDLLRFVVTGANPSESLKYKQKNFH